MITEHRCWVYGDNVNTDVIFPGKYTYTLRTPEEIASKALEDLDPTFANQVKAGDIIIGGSNWGCGSSREQAVTALKYVGVKIIVASSFSGLYFRNCINQGVHPVVCPDLHLHVATGDIVQVDYTQRLIIAKERHYPMPQLSPSVQAIIDAGGLVAMLRRRFGDNNSLSENLPQQSLGA